MPFTSHSSLYKTTLNSVLNPTLLHNMAIVAVDDSFKRPGNVPFSWEIRPGVPKTQPGNPTLLQPPKKLSPLRLKPKLSHSHSQPLLLPPTLSSPSSSFISNSKSRPLSPLTPSSFSTPSKLKPPPTPLSASNYYSPGPSFRSSPRAFSERWQVHRPNRIRPRSEPETESKSDLSVAGFGCFPSPKFRLRKIKSSVSRRITGWRSENDSYYSDWETMSPWTVSSRRSVSPRWESPKSSFSSLRFSPRIPNEAEWVGFGFFHSNHIRATKYFARNLESNI